jgi:hypothetical protein
MLGPLQSKKRGFEFLGSLPTAGTHAGIQPGDSAKHFY